MYFTRRRLLAALPLAAAGCATHRPPSLAPAAAMPRLPRVQVTPQRVIRTTVGLRPFRPSGFVVRAEKLDEKTVVHNYGHGGCGITLCWGTAQLAADLAADVDAGPARDCAVIGCGVIGLTTARTLQQRGYRTTIYTQAMPPATTTNMAGGLWEPVSLYDLERVTPQFRTQFVTAARFAFRHFQFLSGGGKSIRWMPLYTLSNSGPFPARDENDPNSDIEPLYPDARQLPPAENPFGTPYAYRRYSMLIEPGPFLEMLLRDFELGGGKVVVRTFSSPRDLAGLPERLIFNCTGLGSRTLFNDQELTPIRGQLSVLLPQEEVNYMTLGPRNTYMFPRSDGIILGGSFDRGVSNLEPDPAISDRILSGNRAIFDNMRG
jgi:glycine/D-amino acid oxidase-like deaminating enzyme